MNGKPETLSDGHSYALISTIGFALYFKTLLFSFTYSDDTQLIVINNEFLSHLSNITKLFTKDVFISIPNPYLFFRPILNVSFMFDAQIGGDAPGFYHFTNVVLHVVCSLLVFVLFKKLHFQRLVATSAAVIFCVHPILTSAVAWIPGRNDSLFTLFILSSFIFFLKFLEGRKAMHVVFHFLFWALALFTKETAVVFPFIVLLFFLMVRRESADTKLILIMVVIWAVATGFWLYLRSNVVQSFVVHQTLKEALLNWVSNTPALILYLGKALFPFNLSVYPNLHDTNLWWGIAALIVLAFFIFFNEKKNYMRIVWGMLWFFLFLAPSLVSGSILHEHRAYCSLVGFLIVLYEFPFLKNLHEQKGIVLMLFSSAVLILVVIAFLHSDNFRDREAYCTNAYEKSPSCDAVYSGLAGMYIDQQQYGAAEEVIRKGFARIVQKQYTGVLHRMLGDIYTKMGVYDKAEKEYIAAIATDPLHLQTYVNYGKLCMSQGRFDETEKLWKVAISIDPDFILGYYLLANFFLRQRDDPTTAVLFVQEIEKRGVPVMPELISQIASHQKNRSQNNSSGER